MNLFDYRARNYMTPQFNNTGGGMPSMGGFTGMDIQGPLGLEPDPNGGGYTDAWTNPPRMPTMNFNTERPEVEIEPPDIRGYASQSKESAPFRGMDIQGPGPITSRPEVSTQSEQNPFDSDFEMFDRLYNAPTPALEAYKKHIMSMPQQGNYRPGKFDRVAAALAGVSEGRRSGGGRGFATAQGVINRPYNEALQNYQMQGQGMGQLAEIESNEQKNRMSGLTNMTEARRKAMETLSNIARDQALNQLTGAQTEKARGELALLGMELKQNEATGQLEVVNMRTGARTPIGKFKQTPDEAATTQGNKEIRVHGANAGVDLRNKQIFAQFEAPLKVETAVNEYNALQPSKQANAIAQHNEERMFDVTHPMPAAGIDRMQPSQGDIAFDLANKKVAAKYPSYMKFLTEDVDANMREIEYDPKGYEDFQNKVKIEEDLIRGAAKASPTPAAKPFTPAPFRMAEAPPRPQAQASPLNAPASNNDPVRAQAIAAIKAKNDPNIPLNETTIAQVMKQLSGR